MTGTPGPWFIERHGIMDATRSRTICMFGESDQDDADLLLVSLAPTLLDLVRDFTDDAECQYDHHGYCQAHSLHERPCPHEVGKELLIHFGGPT